MLAVRTDYLSDTDDPHPHLRRIAEAGNRPRAEVLTEIGQYAQKLIAALQTRS